MKKMSYQQKAMIGLIALLLLAGGCANSTAETTAAPVKPGTIIRVQETKPAFELTIETGEKKKETVKGPGPAISDHPETPAASEMKPAETVEVKPDAVKEEIQKSAAKEPESIGLNGDWRFAGFSEIHSGSAVKYYAKENRNGIVIGVNAGHGTSGGASVKTYNHPDKTAKLTGGTNAAGSTKGMAVSGGMTFKDGTAEPKVTLRAAQLLREELLSRGYDVLMIRDGDDVQLDNIARTVLCNNMADCHIAIHWDGDSLDHDKGCFYMSVPDGLKYLDNVAAHWEKSEQLGTCLINGLQGKGCKIFSGGSMDMDLTQTSYSTIPSVDIEMGNEWSAHSDDVIRNQAKGLADGIDRFYAR